MFISRLCWYYAQSRRIWRVCICERTWNIWDTCNIVYIRTRFDIGFIYSASAKYIKISRISRCAGNEVPFFVLGSPEQEPGLNFVQQVCPGCLQLRDLLIDQWQISGCLIMTFQRRAKRNVADNRNEMPYETNELFIYLLMRMIVKHEDGVSHIRL